MKICIISEAKALHTQRWASGLSQAGCEIHLISSYKRDIPGVELHHIPIYSSNPWRQLVNNAQLNNCIRELNPDVIHLFGLFSLSSLGTMLVVRNMKNLIVSVWGSDIVSKSDRDTYKERMIKQFILRHGQRILATSNYLAEEVKKYLDDSKRVDVLPWGVDIDKLQFVNRRGRNENITVGFAKRLNKLSAPDIMLRAYKYARDNYKHSLSLKIAGSGPMEPQLKKDAIAMRLADSIEWLGWLDTPEQLRDFYNSIDMFVMPSRRESFGVAAVEASASGLPVIASRFGGIPEIVSHGETGLLVDTENIKGFGKAIISLAEDEDLRIAMGLRGRKKVEIMFNWETTINTMIEIYRQTIREIES